MRGDDESEDSGGGTVDRAYWEQKAGPELMQNCDDILRLINECAEQKCALNYLRGYIGLQANGVVNNFVRMAPKRTKKFIHVGFRNRDASEWLEKFVEAGVPATSKRKHRLTVSITRQEFSDHQELVRALIASSVDQAES